MESSVKFREEDHTYWLGERQLPGVTTVIDMWAQTYAGIPEEILRPARERGTAVHMACQYDDEGELDESFLESPLGTYVLAWRDFQVQKAFIPKLIEQQVYSQRYQYAGTLDRTGSLQGGYGRGPVEVLMDIKTGSALKATTGLQTAAYAEALRTDRRKKSLPRWGVELHKDGTWRLEEFKDPDDLPTFLAALRLYNWRLKHG